MLGWCGIEEGYRRGLLDILEFAILGRCCSTVVRLLMRRLWLEWLVKDAVPRLGGRSHVHVGQLGLSGRSLRWFGGGVVVVIIIVVGILLCCRSRSRTLGRSCPLLARDGRGVGIFGFAGLARALGFGVGASCRGTVGGDGDLWFATWLFSGGWSGR